MQHQSGPLHGVRIVDCTDERAIYGAKLLADLGADVVRIEPPGGDPLRQRGPFDEASGESLYFAYFASSRCLMRLDLAEASGLDVWHDLLQAADVLLTCDNVVNGIALSGVPDELTHIDTSSFGPDGPWRDYLAPDLVAGALGGAVATTGDAATPPLKAFGELNFMVSGAYVAIAALSSLYAGAAHGERPNAYVSVHEAIASCLEQVLMFYWYPEALGRGTNLLPRRGPTHWSDAFTVMNGKTGSIMITPAPDFDKQLAWLAEEDAHEDLLDPKYLEPENLHLMIARMMQLLAKWVAKQDAEELFLRAQARHAPYGWVQPLHRVPDNPQLKARDWFAAYRVAGHKVLGPGAPYHFGATPWELRESTDVAAASTPLSAAQVLGTIGWGEHG